MFLYLGSKGLQTTADDIVAKTMLFGLSARKNNKDFCVDTPFGPKMLLLFTADELLGFQMNHDQLSHRISTNVSGGNKFKLEGLSADVEAFGLFNDVLICQFNGV